MNIKRLPIYVLLSLICAPLSLVIMTLLASAGAWVGFTAPRDQWKSIGPDNAQVVDVCVCQPDPYLELFEVFARTADGRLLQHHGNREWVDISNSQTWDNFPPLTLEWGDNYSLYIVYEGAFYQVSNDGVWQETGYELQMEDYRQFCFTDAWNQSHATGIGTSGHWEAPTIHTFALLEGKQGVWVQESYGGAPGAVYGLLRTVGGGSVRCVRRPLY